MSGVTLQETSTISINKPTNDLLSVNKHDMSIASIKLAQSGNPKKLSVSIGNYQLAILQPRSTS